MVFIYEKNLKISKLTSWKRSMIRKTKLRKKKARRFNWVTCLYILGIDLWICKGYQIE